MATRNETMQELGGHFQQAVAGLLGGIISLVYAKSLSARSSVVAILCSFVMSYYLGDILALHFHIPPQTAGFIVGLTALRLGAKIASGDWLNVNTWLGNSKSGRKDDD